jgi:hypothetical protein
MTKIIIINEIGEALTVATFKAPIEALQCAALLAAMQHPEDKKIYYVERKTQGRTIRTQPETLRNTVSTNPNIYTHLKPIF